MRETQLSPKDLSEAVNHKMIFEAGDYLIEARSVVLQGKWHDIFMVTPRCVGGNFGWLTVTTNPFPSGWSYFAKGTATAVAPNNEIAERVLESVRVMTWGATDE